MKIDKDVFDVLVLSNVEENKLFLPAITLDRKLYVSVNKILESIGGKWNRGAKAHIFETDPSDVLDEIINTGTWTDVKKEYQFFQTPKIIVKKLIDLAEIQPDDVLLEPEAGQGAILEEFPKENNYVAFELMPENCKILREKGFLVHERDFLSIDIEKEIGKENFFDKAIANPPFKNQQDVKHIFKMWEMLAKNGIISAVVSESPFFRTNELSVRFRQWLSDNNAYVEELESGDFKESGTMVKTRLIQVRK